VTGRTCSVDGCEWAGQLRKGWCNKHYRRWMNTGDPERVDRLRIDGTEAERFWPRVDKRPDGCWIWTGSTDGHGYGQFRADGTMVKAYRWAYEDTHGPVPAGLELDHVCRVRRCVNPDHLEPVTHRENVLRGESITADQAKRTHCPKGHPYSGANLKIRPNGKRRCVTCHRESERRRKARQRSSGSTG
jgi:hypothetical protein